MVTKPGLSNGLLAWVAGGILVFIALLALALTISRRQLDAARREGEANALRADSAAAVADSTRRVALATRDRLVLLGDSLQAVERRVVQLQALGRDRLDQATDRSSVVRGGIVVTPGRVATSTTAPTDSSSGGVRTARFHVDSSAAASSPRFVADAMVALPPPPAAGSLSLGVTLSPIALAPRVQCGAPDAAGIRPASLAVVAPAGVTLRLEPLEADVHACNPDYGRPRGVRVPLSTVAWVALLAGGIGAVLAAH